MRSNWIFLVFLPLLWACGSDQPAEKQEQKTVAPVNEEDLALRLSMLLIPNARSQAQQDHNKIVDFAIGEMLDIQKTDSGLFYQIAKVGNQEEQPPRWGDVVYVKYTGTFLNGKVFDRSEAGKPLRIKLKQVIPGWQEALQLMRTGTQGLFFIPSYLAYGEKGFGKSIPPNEVLKFELELVEIDRY